jgi:predicted HTH transcriptional regulator
LAGCYAKIATWTLCRRPRPAIRGRCTAPKSFGKHLGGKFELTELQRKILEILKESGGAPPEHLVERLNISPMDLEREIAALRHMEKVRGELRVGKKYIRLW